MSNNLFDTFNAVSSKQWKQKIQFDLKGADYNDTLIWKNNEDIDVKPFYHADDFKTLPNIPKTKATQWKVCQSIFVADVNKSNLKAIDIIERGAESIDFIIPTEDISIKNLIKNIDSETVLLHFNLLFLSEAFTNNLNTLLPHAKINIDCISQLAKTGNWFKSLNDDFKTFKNITKKTSSISVNCSLYQNAGATMVQQLAYALAHANEYLNFLESSEIKSPSLKVIFHISVGTNYFFEIAKLRALRTLWKSLASEYEINTVCEIMTTPTTRNKTLYDYNTNMLRTTTECMSAILGGANTICNLPYDSIYHKSNEFGERISRNQLLILKHESYFNKVNNPSDGSYYIESLTSQLSEKALELFKNIESNGGFLKQLKQGTIQRKIKESATKEQNQFNKGETVLIGTNKHPNTNDKIKDDQDLYPFVKTNKRKTLIEPIIEQRLSEHLEQNRLKNED
ncbi:MAG: methylmalonyl-CoA mutase subunit beta [Algibacter sp.]|uniref:methylmalonyl-CoA mutase subunit beta n=1 Tax=Algibacter sp. TaxID=1872428 RepID=UPI002616D9F4|nr:methylmalonyl-CoA mutase subunit beta [Algibacter sp.]MDG1729871.1 methylmalonyl-CoA mutase subunit beta [Algibacter sp.]MDG2178727.1 methylmalonyl-CoA mutase subunit beta [Algibacter sp.]